MTEIAKTFQPRIGALLPNATRLIALRLHRETGYGYVLALREGDTDPYITWEIRLADGYCFNGHYFNRIDEAVADYMTRK